MPRVSYVITLFCFLSLGFLTMKPQQVASACDIDQAMEICNSLPLDALEGIWLYPEDNVTVMILRKSSPNS